MGILTEEMKCVVAQQQLCYAASVTPDGKPNLTDRTDPWGPTIPSSKLSKIRVETAAEVFSPVNTLTRSSEAEVKRFWLERYGYRSAL